MKAFFKELFQYNHPVHAITSTPSILWRYTFIMIKLLILLTFLLIETLCNAQNRHKDQLEFGYKGKVKVIIKKHYADFVDTAAEVSGVIPSVTYTYYFNEQGNIDSSKTERPFPMGETIVYKTYYKFENGRKKDWEAFNVSNDKILYGKITWISDKEFIEEFIL